MLRRTPGTFDALPLVPRWTEPVAKAVDRAVRSGLPCPSGGVWIDLRWGGAHRRHCSPGKHSTHVPGYPFVPRAGPGSVSGRGYKKTPDVVAILLQILYILQYV